MKETTENKSKLESAVFKAEYQEILSTSISPSNILSFYERALERLIILTEKTIKKYKSRNPETHLIGKDLEDTAYNEAGLQDVASTLDAIQQRQDLLHLLQSHIETELHVSSEVFIPPSDEHKYVIQAGSGRGLEEKLIFPRLLTLFYILENDLGIQASLNEEDESDVEVTKGSVIDSMMRTQPYVRVIIPELKRIVYLCDEEGNASFIFDQEAIVTEGISIETLDVTNKALFEDLFSKHPELGTRIIYSTRWRSDMLNALSGDFIQSERPKLSKEQESSKPKSDFTVRVEVPRKKEGWENANLLRRIVHSDSYTIKTYAKSLKFDHPEWFEVQLVGLNHETEHYHPELVRLIIEHFNKIPMKKEGWESASSLSKVVNSNRNTIKAYAETFKPAHPEWFEDQKIGPGETEHYHPELVRLIIEHFNKIPMKKEGWESASSLQNSVRSNSKTIKLYAETFKPAHPEWFEDQIAGTIKAEHYHPELVRLIIEHFNKIPMKKEGWESASSLQKVVRSYIETIKLYAETFKPAHPEWFEDQKSGKHKTEHYHPELVKHIIKYYESTPPKKAGWENAYTLRKLVHSTPKITKKYIDEFRFKHPEWFEDQIAGTIKAEHYHPELIRLIKEHFGEKKKV